MPDRDDIAGLIFLEAAPVLLQVSIGMIIALAILYIIIYFLRKRRGSRLGGRRVSMNRCSICGHKVRFLSDCWKAQVKAPGRMVQCPKCGKTCEVVCLGCGHKGCEATCEKCVRYV
jgi:hypothetical protein